jgi:hypothetical protein
MCIFSNIKTKLDKHRKRTSYYCDLKLILNTLDLCIKESKNEGSSYNIKIKIKQDDILSKYVSELNNTKDNIPKLCDSNTLNRIKNYMVKYTNISYEKSLDIINITYNMILLSEEKEKLILDYLCYINKENIKTENSKVIHQNQAIYLLCVNILYLYLKR